MNVIYRVCKSYQDMTCRERGVPVPEEQCLMIAGTSIPRARQVGKLRKAGCLKPVSSTLQNTYEAVVGGEAWRASRTYRDQEADDFLRDLLEAHLWHMEGKEAREREKIAWIEQHGSDDLKAMREAGHGCQRLYAIERAALEHPDYRLDFDQAVSIDYRGRTCPSRDAFVEAERVGGKVVWLTYPEKGEAVLIEGFLNLYNLFRRYPTRETVTALVPVRLTEDEVRAVAWAAKREDAPDGEAVLRWAAVVLRDELDGLMPMWEEREDANSKTECGCSG